MQVRIEFRVGELSEPGRVREQTGGRGMKTGFRIEVGGVLGLLCAAAAGSGQSLPGLPPLPLDRGSAVTWSTAGMIDPQSIPADRIVQVIEDRSLGNRWLLCRASEHPGGPGRLVLIASNRRKGISSMTSQAAFVLPAALPAAARPVIRSGERLVIEEDGAMVSARLTAFALESVLAGSAFYARLEIGGQVVRAVAVSAGKAAFAPEFEVGP